MLVQSPPKTLTPAQGAAGFFAALVLAVGLLSGLEGKKNIVYLDGGHVATVCYGHTGADVKMGQPARSDEECMVLLERDAFEHGVGLQACQTRPWPPEVLGSFVSWTYNVGVHAACASTAVRKANAGDFAGACAELTRWNKDNGLVIRGLTNRRAVERNVCEGYHV